jgi:hypothetical protein
MLTVYLRTITGYPMHDLVRLVRLVRIIFLQSGVGTIPGRQTQRRRKRDDSVWRLPDTKAEFPARERMLEPRDTLVVYSEA